MPQLPPRTTVPASILAVGILQMRWRERAGSADAILLSSMNSTDSVEYGYYAFTEYS